MQIVRQSFIVNMNVCIINLTEFILLPSCIIMIAVQKGNHSSRHLNKLLKDEIVLFHLGEKVSTTQSFIAY